MDEIITDVNKKIEKEGKKFADQSKEAIGDVSSFFSAVRPPPAIFHSQRNASNIILIL